MRIKTRNMRTVNLKKTHYALSEYFLRTECTPWTKNIKIVEQINKIEL